MCTIFVVSAFSIAHVTFGGTCKAGAKQLCCGASSCHPYLDCTNSSSALASTGYSQVCNVLDIYKHMLLLLLLLPMEVQAAYVEDSLKSHMQQHRDIMCSPLTTGEEMVTKESFISICWRLIPYWLNNWEQQWGAECSSMMFELPHFAVELLLVLPCVQVCVVCVHAQKYTQCTCIAHHTTCTYPC